jgi:hypothetical protein
MNAAGVGGQASGGVVGPRGQDRVGGEQARFHRRENAFAARRERQTRGVAGEQHAVAMQSPTGRHIQVISVTLERRLGIRQYRSAPRQ